MSIARQRWALAAGSALLTAALAGVGWWLFGGRAEGLPVAPGAGFAPAGPLGFLLEPSKEWRHATSDFDVQVSTNSLGLRGPEVAVPKPADCYRVLALGDSFTFGWGVALEDTWHARMARELTAGARRVEVVDAGVPGWCPLQEFAYLEQRGLDLQPDLVLWEICTNDLLEMERVEVEIDARRLPVSVQAEVPLATGLREDWGALFEKLDETDRKRVMDEFHAGRIDPKLRELARAADAERRSRAGAPPEGRVSELPVDEVLRGLHTGPAFGVRYIDHVVTSARDLCAERGIQLRLMLVYPRSNLGAGGKPDDGVAALQAWAAQQSPAVLDTAELLPAARVEEFYFHRDPHWTSAAHPIVAAAVARWLAGDPTLGLTLVPAR